MCECVYCCNDECKIKYGIHYHCIRIHFLIGVGFLYKDIFVLDDDIKQISELISLNDIVDYCEIDPVDF